MGLAPASAHDQDVASWHRQLHQWHCQGTDDRRHATWWCAAIWARLFATMDGSLMRGVNRSVLNWRDEVRGLTDLKQTHLALNRYGASTLVISYADLLWYPESTLQRLGCFLPCLRPFPASSINFVPRSGVDFNPKSRFKILGTIRSYGDAHPPRGYGYDLTFGRCTQGGDQPFRSFLAPSNRQ